MNNLLQLKGRFESKKNQGRPGPTNLPSNGYVSLDHIKLLRQQLNNKLIFWSEEKILNGALISVHFKRVISKSNRLKILLSSNSKSPEDSICGAKFVWEDNETGKTIQKHVFTYFISLEALKKTISNLDKVINIIDKYYGEKITKEDIEIVNSKKLNYIGDFKSTFCKAIVDCFFVESFQVDEPIIDSENGPSIVSFFKTSINTKDILEKLGIIVNNFQKVDDNTWKLDKKDLNILKDKAPYLVAMSVSDFSELTKDNFDFSRYDTTIKIPKPNNEPTIGVIDTHFDERVYFHEWVEYYNMVDKNIELNPEDYRHGTAITSLIVDGPSINPRLDDGCGRFKVKHFGVATQKRFSSISIMKGIRKAVSENRDIKVWNLSLGSVLEINKNFISPEAAELDLIQNEYDVIFIVAGTNKPLNIEDDMRIGSPADSINSIVVNSVGFDNESASYTRTGPVLSFFHKPDISYYGGTKSNKIKVCEPLNEAFVCGTSYAAPWISRKMAYLIHVIGLNRELAKALLIDSAAGWNRKDNFNHNIGFGIVPIHIEDIINSKNDEIKFTLSGTIEDYETCTYNLPIPQHNKAHPFFARATLCYFPKCSRSQGVDYTSTEMDIHFGRVKYKNGKAVIHSINSNAQGDEGSRDLYEENVRKLYRKWDNTKHISEEINTRARPKNVTNDLGLWGFNIRTKERTSIKEGRGLRFGVVITLKEMNGKNRIDEFIKLCMLRSWMVTPIDVKNKIDIYEKAEEEIIFE